VRDLHLPGFSKPVEGNLLHLCCIVTLLLLPISRAQAHRIIAHRFLLFRYALHTPPTLSAPSSRPKAPYETLQPDLRLFFQNKFIRIPLSPRSVRSSLLSFPIRISPPWTTARGFSFSPPPPDSITLHKVYYAPPFRPPNFAKSSSPSGRPPFKPGVTPLRPVVAMHHPSYPRSQIFFFEVPSLCVPNSACVVF